MAAFGQGSHALWPRGTGLIDNLPPQVRVGLFDLARFFGQGTNRASPSYVATEKLPRFSAENRRKFNADGRTLPFSRCSQDFTY
jgi:hypothetical protein